MKEKLGIKREIIQELSFDCECKNCGEKNVIKIDCWKPTVAQQFAPKMLEALIYINEFIDVYEAEIETLSSQTPSVEKIGLLIEKATGKTWEEIMKLLEDK